MEERIRQKQDGAGKCEKKKVKQPGNEYMLLVKDDNLKRKRELQKHLQEEERQTE